MGVGAFAAAALIAISSLAGCTDTNHPKYVEPPKVRGNYAMLKGSWGTYITRVDGESVDGANFQVYNVGSNKVNVAAGEHELRVVTVKGEIKQTSAFLFVAEAGHTYEFASKSMFDLTLQVRDLTTNQTMLID